MNAYLVTIALIGLAATLGVTFQRMTSLRHKLTATREYVRRLEASRQELRHELWKCDPVVAQNQNRKDRART